jgi:hypothetical protein
LHENSLAKIDPELPLDRAAFVGCGVLTGVGAALRSSGLEAGQTVAVPSGHFDAYVWDFVASSGAACEWFREHLLVTGSP